MATQYAPNYYYQDGQYYYYEQPRQQYQAPEPPTRPAKRESTSDNTVYYIIAGISALMIIFIFVRSSMIKNENKKNAEKAQRAYDIEKQTYKDYFESNARIDLDNFDLPKSILA